VNVTEYVNVTSPQDVETTKTLPGFEGFMAMFGVMGVMWLIMRQKE